MHKLDPAHFSAAPGLEWQACLKMTGVEIMNEKVSWGRICHSIYRYVKANNKYAKVIINILHYHTSSI